MNVSSCLKSQHLEGKSRWIIRFQGSLVYIVRFRTARDTQRNCVLKNQINKLIILSIKK